MILYHTSRLFDFKAFLRPHPYAIINLDDRDLFIFIWILIFSKLSVRTLLSIELYCRKDIIDGTQQEVKQNLVVKTRTRRANHVQNQQM